MPRVIINEIPKSDSSDISKLGIKDPAKVTTTLQPINRKDANSEIEKNETVLNPDLLGFYKSGGVSHKRGGTPVSLKPGSFVFSHDLSLAFTEADKKLLELPKGGDEVKNTPASLSLRIVKPKKYNKWANIIDDSTKDDISKKASSLMIQKSIEKLGAIAQKQEEKKDYPDGVPEWAMGTAPVYEDEMKNDIKEQPQYMREGGLVLPTFAGGTPGIINNRRYSHATSTTTKPYIRKPFTREGVVGVPRAVPPQTLGVPDLSYKTNTIGTAPAPEADLETIRPWQKVPLSPLQKVNETFLAARALSQRPQYPLRVHERFTDFDPTLVNPESTLNAIDSSTALGLSATDSMHPILGGANAQLMQGKGMEAKYAALASILNTNTGISNNAEQYNVQGRDAIYNKNQFNDFNYQNQVDQANLNTTKDRMDAQNSAVNYLNTSLEDNQKLEQFLNSQRTYGKKPVRDANGNITHYEAQTPFVVNNTGWSPTVGYNRGMDFDLLNTQLPGGNRIDSADEFGAMYQKLIGQGVPSAAAEKIVSNLIKAKTVASINDSYPMMQKKGGSIKSMRRKSY